MANQCYQLLLSNRSPNRTLIGFDLRRRAVVGNLFMTSYSDSIRYEDFIDQHQDALSGVNMFALDPSDPPISPIPGDAMVVAYDLPVDFVRCLQKGKVSIPPEIQDIPPRGNWCFKGFDIVDVRTQTSALNGFDLTSRVLQQMLRKCSVRRNVSGLIHDWNAAVRAAMQFDRIYSEHVPFMPSGVWQKNM